MPVRPLTPAQTRENEAFLAELCRTGNVREAARRVGAHRAKFTKRRSKHLEFAALWEAALALSQEILAEDHDFHPGLTRLADGRLQLRARGAYGLNADRRLEFLAILRTLGSARAAAEAIGFSHAAFHHYKARDPDFAREWCEALTGGAAALEEEAGGRVANLTQEEKVELFGPLFAGDGT
jgi:hypothetical protein